MKTSGLMDCNTVETDEVEHLDTIISAAKTPIRNLFHQVQCPTSRVICNQFVVISQAPLFSQGRMAQYFTLREDWLIAVGIC